jgi:hypothetical protein
MDQNVERVVTEIEWRVGRLRADLADLSEAIERESWARARDDAKRERDLAACRDRIMALEQRTLASAGASAGANAGSATGRIAGAVAARRRDSPASARR